MVCIREAGRSSGRLSSESQCRRLILRMVSTSKGRLGCSIGTATSTSDKDWFELGVLLRSRSACGWSSDLCAHDCETIEVWLSPSSDESSTLRKNLDI